MGGREGSVSCFAPQEYHHHCHNQYTLGRRLDGPHNQSGCCREEKNLLTLPRVEPPFLSCPVQSLVTIPNNLPIIQFSMFLLKPLLQIISGLQKAYRVYKSFSCITFSDTSIQPTGLNDVDKQKHRTLYWPYNTILCLQL